MKAQPTPLKKNRRDDTDGALQYMVCLDGSEVSKNSLRLALRLLQPDNDSLLLLSVGYVLHLLILAAGLRREMTKVALVAHQVLGLRHPQRRGGRDGPPRVEPKRVVPH
jgi:hypothetical protein